MPSGVLVCGTYQAAGIRNLWMFVTVPQVLGGVALGPGPVVFLAVEASEFALDFGGGNGGEVVNPGM